MVIRQRSLCDEAAILILACFGNFPSFTRLLIERQVDRGMKTILFFVVVLIRSHPTASHIHKYLQRNGYLQKNATAKNFPLLRRAHTVWNMEILLKQVK